MTHRCVISVDATGIEPVHPRLTTPLWKIEGRSCAFCDSFPDYRSANQAGAGGRPIADAKSAVSGSHKSRPPKFKLQGLSCPVALGAGARCPRSATTDTVGAGSTAGGANFARLLRRLAAAVVVGLKDGAHPLPAASCGA